MIGKDEIENAKKDEKEQLEALDTQNGVEALTSSR